MAAADYGNKRIGIHSTTITDRTAAEVATGPLANTVVHWPATLRREKVLRVYHWPAEQFGISEIRNTVEAPRRIEIRSRALASARAVDYRIYLPRLMDDFVERGGRLEVCGLHAKDIGSVAERFDLVVVASGKNGFDRLFARDDANSPYESPQRFFVAGLFTGFRPTEPSVAARACLSHQVVARRLNFRY